MAKRNKYCPICKKPLTFDTANGEFVWLVKGKYIWAHFKCHDKYMEDKKK
jgi:hypothetical protein